MAGNVLGESFVTVVDWALRWWLTDRGPGLAFVAEQTRDLRPVMRWVAAAVLAFSLVAAAVAVMVTRRGHHVAAGVLGLGRFLLVLSGSWLVFAAGWSWSDALARWILGGSPRAEAFSTAVTDALASAEPAVATSLSVLGAASALAFVAVSLARVTLAVLLMVGLPVVAAAGVVRGQSHLRTAMAWTVAVLLFRPLVSLVYRMGHDLVTTVNDPNVVLLAVPMMFILSAAMLPLVARWAGRGRTA